MNKIFGVDVLGIPRSLLSLAGEYAVVSKLCRIGLYAQLTFGNQHKSLTYLHIRKEDKHLFLCQRCGDVTRTNIPFLMKKNSKHITILVTY